MGITYEEAHKHLNELGWKDNRGFRFTDMEASKLGLTEIEVPYYDDLTELLQTILNNGKYILSDNQSRFHGHRRHNSRYKAGLEETYSQDLHTKTTVCIISKQKQRKKKQNYE